MRRLILFRHGKAAADSESGEDRRRRLTPAGRAEAEAMGRRLAGLGAAPDIALVSPASRTRETWAAAAAAFPDAQAREEPALYLAEARDIRRLAEAAGAQGAAVAVVGHNPGLQELAVRLLLEAGADPALVDRARSRFPPAAAIVFSFDAEGRASCDGLHLPER